VGGNALVQKSLTFTVAICSLNGEKRLPATLTNLFGQISSGTRVIVVDDGSTDRTSEIAKEYGAIVIRHKENMGYGQARQSAVEACETDILAFIDDECLVYSDWFLTLQKDWQMMYTNIAALAGPIIPSNKEFMGEYLNRNNPFAPIRFVNVKAKIFVKRLSNNLFPTYSLQSGYIKSAGNGNLSFRISTISQISGYDTNLSKGGEDDDICERILNRFGLQSIYFDENLSVTHEIDNSISSTLHRSYRYGRASANAWRSSGGIPTFLPLPAFFISLSFLIFAMTPRLVTLIFFTVYPIIISRDKLSMKPVRLLSSFMDPYIRLIIEIANNLGFVFELIPKVINSPRNIKVP
jgi:glycosyltransferase involved in cell wall biosynthesis